MAAPGSLPDNQESEPAFVDEVWKEADIIVRTVHEQKVRDCSQNMDGILVFAGLYSAVLTAFLVESYKTLQPNTTTDLVSLFQRIINQLSVSNDPAVTAGSSLALSTSDLTSASGPSRTAERVNVLWFSSLVLSLASASFCITVQQWLREFLALADEEARCRLRIRHFREHNLSQWNVFEIAAILPVLIQISLALFFVGLCYFTAAVNGTVGYVTLPLVSAWAFLFVSSIVLPITVPQCPYKVPIIQSILTTRLWWIPLQISSRYQHIHPSHLSAVSQAENKVKQTDEKDLEILFTVASLRLGDKYLTETIWRVLQSTIKSSTDRIKFIRTSIDNMAASRRRTDSTRSDSSSILLSGLITPNAYNAFAEMVASVIHVEFDRQEKDQERLKVPEPQLTSWFHECFFVLFTSFEYHSSELIDKAIHRCLSRNEWRGALFAFLEEKAHWHTQDALFALFLDRIRGGLLLMKSDEEFDRVMNRICPVPDGRSKNTDEDYRQAIPVLVQYLSFEFETTSLRIKARGKDNLAWGLEQKLVHRVIDLSALQLVQPRIPDTMSQTTKELLQCLLLEWTDPPGIASVLQIAWGPDHEASQQRVEKYIKDIFFDNHARAGISRLLIRIIQIIDPNWQAEPIYKNYTFRSLPRKRQHLDGLQMCHFYLDLIHENPELIGDEKIMPLWNKLFGVLAQHLTVVTISSDTSITQKCLNTLRTIPLNTARLQQNNIFPPELISELQRVHGSISPPNITEAIQPLQPTPTVYAQAVSVAIYNLLTARDDSDARPQPARATIQPAAASHEGDGGEVGDESTTDPALELD